MLHEVWGGARLLDVHDLYGIDSTMHPCLVNHYQAPIFRFGFTTPIHFLKFLPVRSQIFIINLGDPERLKPETTSDVYITTKASHVLPRRTPTRRRHIHSKESDLVFEITTNYILWTSLVTLCVVRIRAMFLLPDGARSRYTRTQLTRTVFHVTRSCKLWPIGGLTISLRERANACYRGQRFYTYTLHSRVRNIIMRTKL